MAGTLAKTTLGGYVRPHARDLTVGSVLLLGTNLLDKVVPFLLGMGIDRLRGQAYDGVARIALIVLTMASAMWVVRTTSRIRVFNVGRDVELDVRRDLLARLHQLGPSFLRSMSTGEVMSRATNDVGQIRLLVGFGVLNVVNSTIAYVGCISLMLYQSPSLTLYALAPYPLLLLVSRAFGKVLFTRSQRAQAVLGELASRTQESLTGIRLTRAYAMEAPELARFELLNQRAAQENMGLVLLRALMWPVLGLVGQAGRLVVAAVGVRMIVRNELTPGELATFGALLVQLDWPTLALGYLLGIVQRGRASFERVADIIDAEPDVKERPDAARAEGRGGLEVRDLRFERGGRTVLDGVSFTVPAEGSLAIVGTVGSGKSTLAALIPRLLDTPHGQIFLDGADVTELELRSLRHAVGYAQQEPFLFSTTVERNVAFSADPSWDAETRRERVRRAADEACILDEIEGLPEGFETLVGERGVQLSGGQKQRVSLARALLAGPRVLVLDDPMSAVDARTESRILRAIERAGEGRTLILVTNRVEAARRCAAVVVLDQGRVVERGTHDALVAQGGLYARMAETQALERELALP